MTNVKINTKLFKKLIGALDNETLALSSVMIKIRDKKLSVKVSDAANFSMIIFNSIEECECDSEEFDLPMFMEDLKVLSKLSTNTDDITLNIDGGKVTCTVGKVKKMFSQPTDAKYLSKSPKISGSVFMEIKQDDIKQMSSAFDKIVGSMDIKAEGTKIVFSHDESGTGTKNTFYEFDTNTEEHMLIVESSLSTYDGSSLMNFLKYGTKGSRVLVEFGNNIPLKINIEDPSCDIIYYIAPRISD